MCRGFASRPSCSPFAVWRRNVSSQTRGDIHTVPGFLGSRKVSLEKSAEASLELDRQREVYRDFARAGSTLFFLVETMKVLNSSLSNFIFQVFLPMSKRQGISRVGSHLAGRVVSG